MEGRLRKKDRVRANNSRRFDLLESIGLDSLKFVEPMTENQQKFFDSYDSDKQQLLLGYPGTGKTYIALYKALLDIQKGRFKRVVIVRSAVATRDIGFLPGSEVEKASVYTLPYKKICSDLFGKDDAYEILEKHGVIRFMLTSYVRGLTLDNSVIIADEIQNFDAHSADSIISRYGKNCRTIFCGDVLQRDLTKPSEKNIEKFLKVLHDMPEWFDVIHFNMDDIVRSDLVKAYIKAKHSIFHDGY